jgi:L-aspartate oxidase
MARTLDVDVCIAGAGLAGLFAVLTLPEGTDVVVLDKGYHGQGSSPLAQGGLAAAVGPGDSPELHLRDTIAAGAGLVDWRAAQVVCREAPDRVHDLIGYGCNFDREGDGSLNLAREGGQSVPRSVHHADATGAEIVRALRPAAEGRFQRLEASVTRVTSRGERCTGVWAMTTQGESVLIRSRATMLASGGAGALFASTTNAPASTGDALALSRGAGARLMDLEFVQFHPTALKVPASPRPLLTEALRGAGAKLVDRDGKRFMVGRHPDAELAPRHVVTAGILAAGDAFLDATDVGGERLAEEFPTVVAACRENGFDIEHEPIPVIPAAHFVVGGVATTLDGRTSLRGLYAAGECAATGMHGANRMAGNSLAESVVFSHRASHAMLQDLAAPAGPDPEWESPPEPPVAVSEELRDRIISAVTLGAGPIRDAESSRAALLRLKAMRAEFGTDIPAIQEGAMLASGELLVRGALAREETRGVHVRRDFPESRESYEGLRFLV